MKKTKKVKKKVVKKKTKKKPTNSREVASLRRNVRELEEEVQRKDDMNAKLFARANEFEIKYNGRRTEIADLDETANVIMRERDKVVKQFQELQQRFSNDISSSNYILSEVEKENDVLKEEILFQRRILEKLVQ